MDTLILEISPEGYLAHFIFFSLITIILAILVYLLLTSRRFRRHQYKTLGTLQKTLSLGIVLPLAGLALYHFYDDDWNYFFTLEKNSNTIEIGYYYPKRVVTLNSLDQITISTTSHIKKSGLMFRFVIKTVNGKEYKSQLISKYNLENITNNINNRLGIKVKN
jgi:hypothetical protein